MTKNIGKKLPDSIQTDRLNLRAPNMADAPSLHQLANNKAIYEFLARLPHPYTRAHAVDFITNLARTRDEQAYAITTKDDNFIGVAGWHLDRETGLELGYWIGEPYWGQGYATEASIALVNAARDCGHKKLYALAISENTGSCRVLEKSGFIKISAGIDDCGVHKNVHVTNFRWESDNG